MFVVAEWHNMLVFVVAEENKMLVSASCKDPYELSVSASQIRSPPSTRQSHNTPVSNQSVTSIPY